MPNRPSTTARTPGTVRSMNDRCRCGNKNLLGRDVCWRCDRDERLAKKVAAETSTLGRATMRTRHKLTTGPIPALCGHCAFQGRMGSHKCYEPTMEVRGLSMPASEARIKGLCPLVIRGAA